MLFRGLHEGRQGDGGCPLPAVTGQAALRPSLLVQSCRVTHTDPSHPVEGSRGHEALPMLLPRSPAEVTGRPVKRAGLGTGEVTHLICPSV